MLDLIINTVAQFNNKIKNTYEVVKTLNFYHWSAYGFYPIYGISNYGSFQTYGYSGLRELGDLYLKSSTCILGFI